MREPYPPLEPRRSGWLDVGAGHELWFEDCGVPHGLPVVFLHGGPGSGCKPGHRQFFDPARYRIVLLDQRGCGRSRPLGRVQANTTPLLVQDLELLRATLGIERWVVFGGSWGATLALCYGAAFPERVLGFVLRGSFLARPRDLDWYFRDGASRLFPRAWQRLTAAVPPEERALLLSALYRRVFGPDAGERDRAVTAWNDWGSTVALANLAPGPSPVAPAPAVPAPADPEAAARVLASTRIELHYAAARYFLADDPVLARAARCPRVPTFILHGERDCTCTPEAALALHAAMPWAVLEWLPETGHLASEPRMTDALIGVTDRLPALLA
jgi:proline iminopeptidase